MTKHTKQSGFTLVELAIVLVIIGLIVGGVLAGSDLIKAATMQKAIKQISDTETGAATFRNKYNDLPGDLKNPKAIFTGMAVGSIREAGMGDGNGVIEATVTGATPSTATTAVGASGEAAVFYYELNQAGYIKEPMTSLDVTVVTTAQADVNTGMFLPSAIGLGAMLIPASKNGANYIVFSGAATGDASAGVAPLGAAMTPLQASNIDGKLDDGNPDTGNVRAVGTAAGVGNFTIGTPAADGADATHGCKLSGVYNASLSTQLCSLSIRSSF